MPEVQSIDSLLAELTLDEKCSMLAGLTAWIVPGCERLGIPEWTVSDGPVGVRGRIAGPGLVVPGPSALAATWDPELLTEVGAALGAEARDRKVDMLLAPSVNIHRVPRCGRHFEYFSEDPLLSARCAVAYIRGVQSQRVGACVKHFVANEQEHERRTIDTLVDERTLREIYLPPFEAAVREAGVRSVMGAYNYVNGVHACAHHELIVQLLEEEWGFEGFVVSDWGAMKDTIGPARGGLDLEMPGPGLHWGHGKLRAAVEAGEVAEADVDAKVKRVIGFLDWAGRLGTPTDHDEESVERAEHRALARRAACESMVLVRNPVGALPLDASAISSIALVGPGAAETAIAGGGSAALQPHRVSNLRDALAARFADSELEIRHAPGVRLRRGSGSIPAEWLVGDGATVELFDGPSCAGEPVRVDTGRGLFNVWMDEQWPDGVEVLSVRLRATVAPPESGRYRCVAVGFGRARLFVDGELVADNEVGGFTAGLGMHAGAGWVHMHAGREHELVLEHTPGTDDSQWIVITDVGAELDTTDPDALLADAEAAAAGADVAVVVVGSSSEWETEGSDRESLELPAGQDELVRRVAAASSNTIVVLNCGAPVTMPWIHQVGAVLLAWYPGQEAGDAIVDVLFGDAEPAGRMPTTWPVRERDTPAFTTYPGEAGAVRYGEGVFVGYRWYDTRGIEPLIPFGHGGSYTTFEWGAPAVIGDVPNVVVEVAVTNTGHREGTEVVQCYVTPAPGSVLAPEQQLAGFAKLCLRPGETGTARIELSSRSFARWDASTHDWVVDPGCRQLRLGASSRDRRATIDLDL